MTGSRLLGIVCLLAAASNAFAQDAPRQDGWVVISVDDYRGLRARAFPPDPAAAPPPVDATVTRVHYDLTAADASITGTAALTVDVLKEGWVDVHVPPGLLVRSATVDGHPVSLLTQPSPHVLLSKPGRAVLTLQIVLPLTVNGATASFSIPPAPAPLVDAALRVPRPGIDLVVQNGFVAGDETRPDESRWTIHGRAGEPLLLSWRQRTSDQRAKLPFRLRGSVTELVGLGEDATQVSATIQLDAAQGSASSVAVGLPPGLTIAQVSGPLVADWDTSTAGLLTVTFLEPLSSSTTIVVNGERRGGADGATSVPLLRLPDAEREAGGLALEVLGAGEITQKQPRALEPADPMDLGGAVRGRVSPSLVAFRFKPGPGRSERSLDVTVARYAAQAVLVANVDESWYQVLLADDGKMLVRARYAVRNNQRSLVSVTLPHDAVLWNTSVAGRPVRPGETVAGALLLPLEKGRSQDDLPPFTVEVVYVARGTAWNTKSGTLDLALPILDLPISRTGMELHYSPRFRVTAVPGSFRDVSFAEPFSVVLRERDDSSLQAAVTLPGVDTKSLSDSVQAGAGSGAIAAPPSPPQSVDALLPKDARKHVVAGVLPVDIPFPAFGPRLFLASELTVEGQAAVVQLSYQRAADAQVAAALGGVR